MNGRINLSSLSLKNFATFTNQDISFTDQFNTIVGETGSGKSLILDALQLCFGARADKSLVRKGSDFASIEALFNFTDSSISEYFDSIGYPTEDEIHIKRIIYSSGKSKTYLNYSSCPLATVNKVTRNFIDLVGQFENQKLLSENHQLKLLDQFSNNSKIYKEFKLSFNSLKQLQDQLTRLNIKKEESLQRKDFLEFQIKELANLDPTLEDEQTLKRQKDKLVNAEENQKVIERVNYLLSDSDYSILGQLSALERELSQNDDLLEKTHEAKNILEDISYEISKNDSDEADENILEEIIERLDHYQKLKRKYRCETEELENILYSYQKEYNSIENIDGNINKCLKEIDQQTNICHELASKLHTKRVKNAKVLSKQLSSIVNKLNMKGAIIDFKIDKSEVLLPSGISKLKIIAQTNPGEGFYPLSLIASGGELSRILLAMRQTLSSKDSISVFLFDEIDTGIGGETAIKIGKALQEVATKSQVIAITHLPQIANFSNQVIHVDKKTFKEDKKMRTISEANIYKDKEISPLIKQMQAI